MFAQLGEMTHELPLILAVVGCVLNDTIKRALFAFTAVDSMSIIFVLSLALFLVSADTHVSFEQQSDFKLHGTGNCVN